MEHSFVPTRFLSHSTAEDGTLILHCSRTGAMGAVPAEQAEIARSALRRSARHPGPLSGILRDLQDGGFLIPDDTDERALVHEQYLSKYDDTYLHLIIMPTEHCNFRCLYCYEPFLRGPMSDEIQEGIRRYVRSQRGLRRLDIHWFGGEPLLAPEIIAQLTRFFSEHCDAEQIEYTASMTTNGYHLTPAVAEEIIPRGVNHFQITLDGKRADHDKRRMLDGGGDTFDVIWRNLRHLKGMDLPFNVVIRHNFDPETVGRLSGFITMLKEEFGGDSRFTTLFEPVGKWGGPNDSDLSVCEGRTATQEVVRAKRLAIEAGFRSGVQVEKFQPNGYVCYAANPRSFVIGSDGQLYKCTVELDYHDRNIVGRLHPDGSMELDWRKMALWCETNGLDEGKKCGACFFNPTCHGAICPKQWMDDGECGCPHERIAIHDVLPLLAHESRLPAPPAPLILSACVRE